MSCLSIPHRSFHLSLSLPLLSLPLPLLSPSCLSPSLCLAPDGQHLAACLSLRLWLTCLQIWRGSDIHADRDTGGLLAAIAAKYWKKRQRSRRRGRERKIRGNRRVIESIEGDTRERCVSVVSQKRSRIISHYLTAN